MRTSALWPGALDNRFYELRLFPAARRQAIGGLLPDLCLLSRWRCWRVCLLSPPLRPRSARLAAMIDLDRRREQNKLRMRDVRGSDPDALAELLGPCVCDGCPLTRYCRAHETACEGFARYVDTGGCRRAADPRPTREIYRAVMRDDMSRPARPPAKHLPHLAAGRAAGRAAYRARALARQAQREALAAVQ
jgi:hypothetical protein